MTTPEKTEPIDWRERLYSLPRDSEPVSLFYRWLFRAVFILVLFFGGSLFIIVSGGLTGIFFDIGPEQTGGAIYVFLGSLLNIITGTVLAKWVSRLKRGSSRLVFYSFTAPVFLFMLILISSLAGQIYSRVTGAL